MTNYRKGSMGAADAKEFKTALIVFSAIYLVVLALFLLPFNPCSDVGFFHYFFTNAGWGWKVIGIISVLTQAYFAWFKLTDQDFGVGARFTPHDVVLIFWEGLNIAFLSGWDWDLPNCS